jgi:hypothetical protein
MIPSHVQPDWATIIVMLPFWAVLLPRAYRRAAWELWIRRTTGRWPE